MFDRMIQAHVHERHEDERRRAAAYRAARQATPWAMRVAVARRLLTVAERLDPDAASVTALPERPTSTSAPSSRAA